MKGVLVVVIALLSAHAYSQFAIVADKDGYVNVRKDKETGSSITDTLKNGHLIYCFENNGNWTNIDYSKDEKELNGYVYKDRFILISAYRSIPISTQDGSNTVKLSKDSIEVVVTQKLFDKRKHRYSYFKQAKSQIELIDNKKYWGTDGEMPKAEYSSIVIKIGKKIIELPNRAFNNLFEPNLSATQVNFDETNNIFYVQSMNSDGAGAYEVIWKVEKGIYKERYIAYGF